jgi:hypothetical protein
VIGIASSRLAERPLHTPQAWAISNKGGCTIKKASENTHLPRRRGRGHRSIPLRQGRCDGGADALDGYSIA